MIGLDTNVLVRYFVADDPQQAKRAAQIIENSIHQGEKIFISQLVLCELMWVLLGPFHLQKKQVIELLEKILKVEQFEIEDSQEVWNALSDYRRVPVDFSDCLIGRKNQAKECSSTFSFDQSLKKLNYFHVLK